MSWNACATVALWDSLFFRFFFVQEQPLRLRGGAKRRLTESELRLVAQAMKRTDEELTSVEIQQMLKDDYENEVSPSWVRKWWRSERYIR